MEITTPAFGHPSFAGGELLYPVASATRLLFLDPRLRWDDSGLTAIECDLEISCRLHSALLF
jgi:hypothetical protein